MNSNQPKSQKKKKSIESVTAVMLIVFILFSSVFSGVLISRYATDTGEKTPIHTTPKPSDPIVDPPVVSNPVFSGGVIPAYPKNGNATVTLNSEIGSGYAVIVDAETGEILAGKNADTPFSPASMTKVMTLIVACEKLTDTDLSKRLKLTAYYNDYKYNGMDVGLIDKQLYLNDEFLIKDLLYGIGVASAADCCLLIAEYTYGTMEAFVAAMNQKAAELGCKNTLFTDAMGDHVKDADQNNLTTANDMAVILAYAMQIPLVKEILSEDCHAYEGYYLKNGAEASYPRYFHSHLFESDSTASRMVLYQQATGVKFALNTTKALFGKTGYLKDEDNTNKRSYLVCGATGKTTGKQYIVVVGDNPKIPDTMKDIKYLFDNYAK